MPMYDVFRAPMLSCTRITKTSASRLFRPKGCVRDTVVVRHLPTRNTHFRYWSPKVVSDDARYSTSSKERPGQTNLGTGTQAKPSEDMADK